MADSKDAASDTAGGKKATAGLPLVIGSDTLSAEQERKRKQMLEKFKASHDAVSANSGQAANSAASVADAELARAFRMQLDATRVTVRTGVDAASKLPTTELAAHFKQLSDTVGALEAALARTVQVMAAHEQRSASNAIKELNALIAAERTKRVPVKKTAFGSKAKANATASTAAAAAPAATTPTAASTPAASAAATAAGTSTAAVAASPASATATTAASSSSAAAASSSSSAADAELAALLAGADARTLRFDNRHNEVLFVDEKTVAALDGGKPAGGGGGGAAARCDIWLRNCSGVTLSVCVVTSAIRIDNVSDCTFLLAPVSGSVHIEHAARCTFAVASRQLRIHTTTDTAFYVRTRSGPIIEHCTRVTFAPYHYAYPLLHDHLRDAELIAPNTPAAATASSDAVDAYNQWSDVKDFQWLREAVASPNWSVLPAAQRAPTAHPVRPTATAAPSAAAPAPAAAATATPVS